MLETLRENLTFWWHHKVLWPLYDKGILKVKVIGYMDKVDFECELGGARGGNTVYPSIEDLRENKSCLHQCGIVEVEVRRRKIIQQENFWNAEDDG